MKAIVFEGKETIAVQDIPVPQPKEGWSLIHVSHAGVCGSDMTIYSGKHPRAKAPLVMGHEFSGYLESEHPTISKGALVTVFPYLPCNECEPCKHGQFHVCRSLRLIGIDLDGGMAEYVTAPNDAIFEIAPGVPPEFAAFIEPIGISVHVARKGGYRPGDSVVVFGAGGIGIATAITLQNFGAQEVIVCEPNSQRLALAKKLGFVAVPSGKDTLSRIMELTNGRGADFVFDCAGHQSVVDILPDAVRIGGTIVIVAGYKNPPTMDFQKGMFREFDIRFVRNCSRQEFAIACGLMEKEERYGKLLNCILPLDKAQEGFDVPEYAYKVMFSI